MSNFKKAIITTLVIFSVQVIVLFLMIGEKMYWFPMAPMLAGAPLIFLNVYSFLRLREAKKRSNRIN